MHLIRTSEPSPALRQYIRYYANREARLTSTTIVHPIPARAAPAVEFTFGDPYRVCIPQTGVAESAPQIVVVGPQTYRRVELVVWGRVDAFAIFFEATGLEIADKFLLHRCRSPLDLNDIGQSAHQLRLSRGRCRIDHLAEKTSLGIRQFQRKFSDYVGVSPKLYARILRFEAALESKAASPHKAWTEVAHELGYHDQMHLVHDFQQLAGETPTSVVAQLEAVFQNERALGNRKLF